MEETLVLWVGLCLVVNKLDFDCLHWAHNDYCLSNASPQATQQRSTLC